MSLPTNTDDLLERIVALREAPSEPEGDTDVAEVVRGVIDSLEGDLTKNDLKLFRELEELAGYIAGARMEIAALRPDQISSQHIPQATDELDAIVSATEDATNKIMEAAEKIEKIAPELAESHNEALCAAVTNIYEACGFQDITGQRISKIVNTLRHIEAKVEGLVAFFSDEIEKYQAANPDSDIKGEPTGDDSELVHGPQLDGDAQSQAEIDVLLASFD